MDDIAACVETAAEGTSQHPMPLNTDPSDVPSKIICSTPQKLDEELSGNESCVTPLENKSAELNVNDKLKKKLEKHGIARQNVNSFLIGLLKDREFKNLVKTTNLEDEDSSDEDPPAVQAAPMTRAKFKQALQNSPFKAPLESTTKNTPKFTEIPLPEDDDDEEYQPVESSFGSDTQDRSLMDDENVHLNEVKDDSENVAEKNIDDVCKTVTETAPVDESDIGDVEGDDIISKRTRSKHSLQSTSLDVLEAAFDPPDATPDMYDNTSLGDYDWHKWLVDLMKDNGGKDNVTEDEDNPEEDPDFNFTPELDRPDDEDMRDDQSVQVSKKELYGLLDEIENMQNNAWPPVTVIKNPSPDASQHSLPPKKQVKPKPTRRKRRSEQLVPMEAPLLEMSLSQIELLKQQMQQHVQLLAQSNILCRNCPELENCIEEAKELLLELQQIGRSQMNILDIQDSHVIPWNLDEAIDLTGINVPPSKPIVRLLGKELSKGHESIPKAVAEVIANSNVFMYRELLPLSAPSSKSSSQKIPFRAAEDCLVTLGLAEMEGMENSFELISQHMLPTKTDKQIQVRIRNVLSLRNLKDSVNPIQNYHVCRTLPKPRNNISFVHQHTAKKPIEMTGTLPCWVLALKPVYGREESSDNSTSDFLQPQLQSTPHEDPCSQHTKSQTQPLTAPPYQAVMVPFSIVHAVPVSSVSTPLIQGLGGPKTSTGNASSVSSQLPNVNSILPSLSTGVTPTSITTKPISSTKIHTSPEFGRRRSAGKSIKRLSETAIISLSSPSSSSSEDEVETEDKLDPSTSAKDDTIPSEGDENNQAESDDDEQSDNEESHKNKPSDAVPAVTASHVRSGDDPKLVPIGGYLQKIHPKLNGKKGRPGSRDLRRAKSTAKMVKTLEEDTIVQLDPRRIEKEKLFAAGYLKRVEKSLKNNPEVYRKFLETLFKYSDGTKSPIDLYAEISTLLQDWPDLLQGFAPFLMPEQARECGLNSEQEVYGRARKFLRQLEIQFNDNPGHMDKILKVFHNVAETAIYREEEMMKSILNLLKDYPYLQDEFLTFFDEQFPPKVLFDEDFEEVDLTEELMKDPSLNQYEYVNLPPDTGEPDAIPSQENMVKKPRKRKISLGSRGECKSPAKAVILAENKENISPELVNSDVEEDGEETGNTDYESEDAVMEDVAEDLCVDKPSTSIPPELAVISENALSSSPFKRITEEAAQKPIGEPLRPDTPTGLRLDSTTSATLSTSPLPQLKSSNDELPAIPATPGKVQPTHAEGFVDNCHLARDGRLLPASNGKVTEDRGGGGVTSITIARPEGTAVTETPLSVIEVVSASSLEQLKRDSEDVAEAPQPGAKEKLSAPSESCSNCGEEEVSPLHAKQTLPSTPAEEHPTRSADMGWTRQADEIILTACQKGITPGMFAEVGETLGRTASDVEGRLTKLLRLFSGGEIDDAVNQESEEDGDIYSDSSAA